MTLIQGLSFFWDVLMIPLMWMPYFIRNFLAAAASAIVAVIVISIIVKIVAAIRG